ncbi:hypothetical protein [Streptomyces reniochalinae]|uniref:Thioesterase domain-containing protein n=1 Tax=Streptomyces reniochalinae TaxID=2250578 RepID=A0A367E8Y6_9ACTN|nr:hypothetical protein [Streptomyces reniochalinae]RCG13807.1 hypothetical protein DQ392_30165 [Streptomyces reniochalinae]
MSISSTWAPLRTSSSSEVILCADFHTTGRPEAGFSDLVPQLEHDGNYWLIAPPAVAPDSGVDVDEYIGSWLAPVRESGMTVRAVLGFCVGSVYGASLADELAKSQGTAPKLIVFDPEPTQLVTIQYQLTKVLDMLDTILSEAERAEIHAELGKYLRLDGMTVGRYAAEMFGEFRRISDGAFARAGLDTEYSAEMWSLFSSFLSYLSLAEGLNPRPAWLDATALSSSSPHNGLNRLKVTGEMGTGEFVAHEIRFDEDHAELLRSPGVAETVDKLLER